MAAENSIDTDASNTQIENPPSRDLSARVYENPSQFLEAVKSNFDKFDTDKSGDVTKDELRHYLAQDSTQESARLAASTVLDHFGDLKSIKDSLPTLATKDLYKSGPAGPGISGKDLELFNDTVLANSGEYIRNDLSNLKWAVGYDAMSTVGGGLFFTGELLAAPTGLPTELAMLATAGWTGGWGMTTWNDFTRRYSDPTLIKLQFKTNKSNLDKWFSKAE